MRAIRQLLGSLATGYILMFYSEFCFWARVRPGDSLAGWASTWIAYSILAFVFLSLLARFRIQSIWSLFLAGAVFGWLAEGVIVQTTYESLPLSISFTGLAWHALISVWVGWYAVRKALGTSYRSTLLLSALIGLGYGFWAISWWVEPDGGVALPLDFARYALTSTILLLLAYWIADRCIQAVFTPNRVAEIVVSGLILMYFIIVTLPAAPVAAIILPALFFAINLALRRNQVMENRKSLLDDPAPGIPVWHYLGLLALPLTATMIYTCAFWFGLRWQTNWLVYLVTTPAGFIVLILSFINIWRAKTLESV
jgi:hypothetical protein